MPQHLESRLVDGQLITELVDDAPAVGADITVLREKVQSATSIASLRSALLDVLDAIDNPSDQ